MLSRPPGGRVDISTMTSNRIVIACLGVVVVLGVGVASAFVTVLTWFVTCDGDGGYPSSAPGSVAGRFCDSPGSTAYFVAELALPILIAAVLSISAGVRRKLGRVGLGLGIALAVLLTMGLVAGNLPDRCSAVQTTNDPEQCDTH